MMDATSVVGSSPTATSQTVRLLESLGVTPVVAHSLRSDFLLALTVKHSMSFSLTIRNIFQAMKKILMNTQVRLLRRRKRP